MSEFKMIDENTKLTGLRAIGWDLVIGDVPYNVYDVSDHVHTIGGRWGNNSYWACPANEQPTVDNMIQFNGEAPTWGVVFDRVNYMRNKWNESSAETNGVCWITRNGEKFYEIPARDMAYGLAKAQHLLVQLLEECPLNLSERNWKEQAVGMKIWYYEQPAIIERITSDNSLWIKPDGIPHFNAPVYWEGAEEFVEDYGDGLRADLLCTNIQWFRNTEEV